MIGKILIGIGAVAYAALFVLTPVVYMQYQSYMQEKALRQAKNAVIGQLQAYKYDAQTSGDIEQSLTALTAQIRDKTARTSASGQGDFERQSQDMQTAITHLVQVATYTKKVGTLLSGQQFGGKFISSDDATKQAEKWQTFNDALKKIDAPVFVRTQHDVLVASTAAQVAIAKKASEAYKANDSAALAVQTKAANDELAKIKAVYDDMYASVRGQQTLIVTTVNKL